MIKSEFNTRVLYAHTDKMGVVSNTRYLEYFEAGRTHLLRVYNYPYTKMESENIGLPVIEAYCKYIAPIYYDDELKIVAYLKNMPTARIKIDYEIYSRDVLIAEGFTIHCFVNLLNLKPLRPPQKLIEILKKYF